MNVLFVLSVGCITVQRRVCLWNHRRSARTV